MGSCVARLFVPAALTAAHEPFLESGLCQREDLRKPNGTDAEPDRVNRHKIGQTRIEAPAISCFLERFRVRST